MESSFLFVILSVLTTATSNALLDSPGWLRNTTDGLDSESLLGIEGDNSDSTKCTSYDFIIVGSGSAGCVLANRLTEVTDWCVLLLEAGKEESKIGLIPAVAPLMPLTDYNWQYLMEYQEGFALGMEDNLLAWPKGRALGGSSVINHMIYTRGNTGDYKKWEEIGNPGWGYEDVLPYFLKSEDGSTLENIDHEYHRSGGYMTVENPYHTPITEVFLKAGQETGVPTIDYNSADNLFGFSALQSVTRNGRRLSSARAFIKPINDRPNLRVKTSAYVTKLLIDSETLKAYGVEYTKDGQNYMVNATKEVILSAGTFNSPQLLMLAGVGPKHHLTALGIPTLVDLPVGQKLYDHVSYIGLIYYINTTDSIKLSDLQKPTNMADFLINRKGIYITLGGAESIGYIKTNISEEPSNYPDIELLFIGGSPVWDDGLFFMKSSRIRDEIFDKYFKPVVGKDAFTIFPMLVHPISFGHLKLRSKNPFDHPILHGNYYTDPENKDIKTMIAAINYTLNLCENTEPFQKIDCHISTIPVPGCEDHQFRSDEYWECALRTLSVTLHHQVATVKMGPANDTEAAVGPDLKVHGVDRLRVVDCSVIPVPLTAHTHAPATMVAEKASDIIKSDWGLTSP